MKCRYVYDLLQLFERKKISAFELIFNLQKSCGLKINIKEQKSMKHDLDFYTNVAARAVPRHFAFARRKTSYPIF